MAIDPARLLVTGANGVLGRHLFRTVAERSPGATRPAAVVRSERAAATLRELPKHVQPEIHVVDYRDAAGLAEALRGRDQVVHLVGILKESKLSRYADAHENASAALAEAAAKVGVARIVYLSILGSSPDAVNACLASKGRAEQLLLQHEVPATVIRLPMVLGRGDQATRSLRGQARAKLLPMVGGGRSMEQPIDADDVVEAILAAFDRPEVANQAFDLAGPESLPTRELVARAAKLWGNSPRVVSLPVGLIRRIVRLLERFSSDPPFTEAMLEVLLHDDRIDPAPAAAALGITLTPLDETIARRIGPGSEEGKA